MDWCGEDCSLNELYIVGIWYVIGGISIVLDKAGLKKWHGENLRKGQADALLE